MYINAQTVGLKMDDLEGVKRGRKLLLVLFICCVHMSTVNSKRCKYDLEIRSCYDNLPKLAPHPVNIC